MPLSIGTPLPSFTGATHWLENTSPAAASSQTGPLLVQFWAVSCPICKLNMPGVLSLLDTYRDQNLQLVSVHRPRMESDMDIEQVRAAAHDLHLVGPCALDNDHSVGDLFQTASVWPCYFFFDADHKMTTTETAKEKFERERLTRRQALKKFGMTSAMATLALFSVDDLARMVGGAMERQARNSKIAAQVAQEFQHSGIALGADMPYYYSSPPYYSTPSPYYYADCPSPAGDAGRAYGSSCATNPGVDSNGNQRNCIDCLKDNCKAKYPPYGPFDIIPEQSYTVCIGAGNANCAGSP